MKIAFLDYGNENRNGILVAFKELSKHIPNDPATNPIADYA